MGRSQWSSFVDCQQSRIVAVVGGDHARMAGDGAGGQRSMQTTIHHGVVEVPSVGSVSGAGIVMSPAKRIP
jgi:hypothetical protein